MAPIRAATLLRCAVTAKSFHIVMPSKKENSGCGCANIPISVILIFLGLGYWGWTKIDASQWVKLLPPAIAQFVPQAQPLVNPTPLPSSPVKPVPQPSSPAGGKVAVASQPQSAASTPTPTSTPMIQKPPAATQTAAVTRSAWEQKAIRGIYLSRYQVTNNASEATIRDRVRFYRQQGFNTIIHGVWGNGCTMYPSQVMQKTFGFKSCPNQFQDQWLNWLMDEAHKQGMEVHAYFEKGIKIDPKSPIFDTAIAKRWLVPGVDRTYAGIDHYVLDVEIPEVAALFKQISVEFVKQYPQIDAVQWDDYLGYHAELPGKVDRTAKLTKFVRELRSGIKQQNPRVSFDLCHHNPYWGKRYFAADWENWGMDRVFIQVYNDANFQAELNYAQNYAGVSISDQQLGRLKALINNPKIKSVLVFPMHGDPETAATRVQKAAF